MLAISLIGVTAGTELCTFGKMPVQLSDDWIELLPSEISLQLGGEVYLVARRIVDGKDLTWVGLYRHALEIGGSRIGNYYGAGAWILGRVAHGEALVAVLPSLADEVHRLAMSGDQFRRRLAEIRPEVKWPETAVDRVGHSMQPLPVGSGLASTGSASAFLPVAAPFSAAHLGWMIDWVQLGGAFAPYARVILGNEGRAAASARHLARLDLLDPHQLLRKDAEHQAAMATDVASSDARLQIQVEAAEAARLSVQERDAELRAVADELARMQDDVRRVQAEHARELLGLQQTIASAHQLHERVAADEAKIQRLERTSRDLRDQLALRDEDAADLKARLHMVKQAAEDHRHRNAELEKELTSVRKAVAETRKQPLRPSPEMLAEADGLRRENKALKDQVRRLERAAEHQGAAQHVSVGTRAPMAEPAYLPIILPHRTTAPAVVEGRGSRVIQVLAWTTIASGVMAAMVVAVVVLLTQSQQTKTVKEEPRFAKSEPSCWRGDTPLTAVSVKTRRTLSETEVADAVIRTFCGSRPPACGERERGLVTLDPQESDVRSDRVGIPTIRDGALLKVSLPVACKGRPAADDPIALVTPPEVPEFTSTTRATAGLSRPAAPPAAAPAPARPQESCSRRHGPEQCRQCLEPRIVSKSRAACIERYAQAFCQRDDLTKAERDLCGLEKGQPFGQAGGR